MPSDRHVEASAQDDTLRAGLSSIEQAQQLLEWVEIGNRYARERKKRFRRRSSTLRGTTLALSAAATIILGLQNLSLWTGLGFSFIAVVTASNAIEPFFAWRFRWVLMEAAQYEFYKIGDELRYRISANTPETLTPGQIDDLYSQYKKVWEDLSGQWLAHRRHAASGV